MARVACELLSFPECTIAMSGEQEEELQKQLEIRREIRRLQAQLTSLPDSANDVIGSPKRKHPSETLLAPATPSPKKKRRVDHAGHTQRSLLGGTSATSRSLSSSGARSVNPRPSGKGPIATVQYQKPAPSNLLGNLSKLSGGTAKQENANSAQRSHSLLARPKPEPSIASNSKMTEVPPSASQSASDIVPNRDDRLAIVEQLEVGPVDHKPPLDDSHFSDLSQIQGSDFRTSRSLPHDDLQEYLRGRYYLSPSTLYSCIRLLPNQSGYDVPVEGDWITIAVVAERGPVRTTRAPVDIAPGGDGRATDDEGASGNANGRRAGNDSRTQDPQKQKSSKSHGKKFVNIKLIDFGAHSRPSSSGAASIRGDAFLTLLLFEADRFDRVTSDDGKVKKLYNGGSKGAFEAMSKLKEGDVITLLNPKVLKPFQRNNKIGKPHPTDNILAVTPESAESIAIIGRAQDLGMCKVLKRDGKICGSWTDKRVSDVCDWHLTNAVQRQRAGRAEFSAGTSGMTTSSSKKRKADYDPQRQWGLQPSEASGSRGGNATYVVSGHVVSGSNRDVSSMFVAENMGREGQARAKRKLIQDADHELKRLLERDKEGMRAVAKAREIGTMTAKRTFDSAKDKKYAKLKGKARDSGSISASDTPQTKLAYSADIIKKLGFDPAAKTGQKRAVQSAVQDKIAALAAVRESRKEINLGPRPGPRIRSGVTVPAFMLEHEPDDDDCGEDGDNNISTGDRDEEELIDLDD
ncbi:uncharacterized protein BJ212DRAFT_1446818 [Suillus subaureus]|uniref:Zinc finger Mcm10/DnaG-type domain-containing protein n=1 Tax=Suillus subaureus TaxID=48587 RepID=A0A9P7EBT5_9AGAM|nr:uncharacterized protein BJ212DRAFT_1446818 [Suillus subaureus]KAG1816707.1 hypothetical protein BJ212DRAFT_1446818 [Suillus subaureus]